MDLNDEYSLRQRISLGKDARELLERIEPYLVNIEEGVTTRFKQCRSDAHDDRMMIQAQMNALDWLRGELVYQVGDAKMAEQELTAFERLKRSAEKTVASLFG